MWLHVCIVQLGAYQYQHDSKCQLPYGLEGLGRSIRGWGHALGPISRVSVWSCGSMPRYVTFGWEHYRYLQIQWQKMAKHRKAWQKKRLKTSTTVHSDERILQQLRPWCHRQLLLLLFHVILWVYPGISWTFTSCNKCNNGNRMKPGIIWECVQVQLLGWCIPMYSKYKAHALHFRVMSTFWDRFHASWGWHDDFFVAAFIRSNDGWEKSWAVHSWELLTCEADFDRALKLDPCNSRALEQKAMVGSSVEWLLVV